MFHLLKKLKENGMNIGEMNKLLLQSWKSLRYMIEQNKINEKQSTEIEVSKILINKKNIINLITNLKFYYDVLNR
jgi:orotate phosphoribosyltransferase-like protein